MKFTEFMKRMSEEYAVGAVAFYASIKDDPWQKSLDHYELDTQMTESDTNHLYESLIKLNNMYKELNLKPKQLDLSDSFYLINREKREKIQSTIEQACAKCGIKTKLIMKRNANYESYLICKECE